MPPPLPPLVAAAQARADDSGFTLACEPGVGRLLAALAAAVPPHGRILEMGTGVGVGTAWIVHGLGARSDVEVVSVEIDAATAAIAQRDSWPPWVSLHVGDILVALATLGSFDLIFADAQGGKWEGLQRTIAALRPGGILLVDDMTPATWIDDAHRRHTARVRDTLLNHAELMAAELAEASGMILATRCIKDEC
jgi:demethylmenaquinone methyltransferase/2-methoxy-6-polyprenyl-1,4-benzoquinol methylase